MGKSCWIGDGSASTFGKNGKGALDVGCGESPVIRPLLAEDAKLWGVDLADRLAKTSSRFYTRTRRLNQLSLDSNFDVAVACSSNEHFGLLGGYGSSEGPARRLENSAKDLGSLRNIFRGLKLYSSGSYEEPVGLAGGKSTSSSLASCRR